MTDPNPTSPEALSSFVQGVKEEAAPRPDVVETVGEILPAVQSDEEHSLSPETRSLVESD